MVQFTASSPTSTQPRFSPHSYSGAPERCLQCGWVVFLARALTALRDTKPRHSTLHQEERCRLLSRPPCRRWAVERVNSPSTPRSCPDAGYQGLGSLVPALPRRSRSPRAVGAVCCSFPPSHCASTGLSVCSAVGRPLPSSGLDLLFLGSA